MDVTPFEPGRVSAPARERLLTREALLAMGVNGVVLALFLAQMTSIGLFARDLGASDWQVGLNASLGTGTALLLRPLVGWMLDRIGRAWTLAIGLVLLAAGGLATVGTSSLPMLFLWTAVRGGAFAFTSTATLTLASDGIPRDRLAEGLSYYGLAATIGAAVGPALGLSAAKAYGFPAFWLATGALAALVLVAAPFLRSPHDAALRAARRAGHRPGSAEHPVERAPLRDLLKGHILWPATFNLLQNIAYSAILTFLTLMAVDRGIPSPGLYFTVVAVASFAVRIVAAKSGERFGYRNQLLAALPLLAGGYLILAFAASLAALVAAGILYGCAVALVGPVLSAILMKGTPLGLRGKANALYLSTSDIGLGVGSALLGVVGTAFHGYVPVYLVAAGFIAVQVAAVGLARSIPGRPAAPAPVPPDAGTEEPA